MFYFGDNEAEIPSGQKAIKERNMRRIFSEVASGGAVSRSSLARSLSLTPSTISHLVEEMIALRLIRETTIVDLGASGRKPMLLSIDPEGMRLPVLAFRRDGIEYTLLNCALDTIEKSFMPYPGAPQADEADEDYRVIDPDETVDMIRTLLSGSRVGEDWVRTPALCMIIPGTFDRESWTFSSTVMNRRGSLRFIDGTRRLLRNLPVFVAGETRMRGYAEFVSGDDFDPDTIFIEIGQGVGSSIFLNGRCYIGATGLAGEIGHISVDPDGPKCLCGNRGCLEKYISRSAVLESMKRLSGRSESWEELCAAYRSGDAHACRVIRAVAGHLLTGISNMACALNMRKVILGGDVTELGEGFIDELRALMQETGYRKGLSKIDIRFSRLEGDSEIRGIARLYQDRYFRYAR